MTRTIAPHDKLDDAAYALVVHALDAAALKDESVRRQLREGAVQLGGDFAQATESERVAILQRVESSPFFQTVRTNTLQVLYATPMAVFRIRRRGLFERGIRLQGMIAKSI